MLRSAFASFAGFSLAVATLSIAREAKPCEAVQIVASPIDGSPQAAPRITPEWKTALDELAQATSQPGQLWSCPGGRLSLALVDQGALVRLEKADGQVVERRVASASDLVPLGEALLARIPASSDAPPSGDGEAAAPAGPSVAPRPRAFAPDTVVAPVASPAGEKPELHIDALFVTEVAGPAAMLLSGGMLRGEIARGKWSAGVFARYAIEAVDFSAAAQTNSVSSVAFGLTGSRLLLREPFRLYAAFNPSITVVLRDGAISPDTADKEELQWRLGAALRAAWPLGTSSSGLLEIGGDFAPAELDEGHRHRVYPMLPAYGGGISLGLQACVL